MTEVVTKPTPSQPQRLGPWGHEIELNNVWLPSIFKQHTGSTGFTVGSPLVGSFLYQGRIERIVLCMPSGVLKVTVREGGPNGTLKAFLLWGEGFQAGCPL